MWSVRTIPPNNLVPTQLKVAAYCRVSTNSLEQQTSLSSQEQYYEEWIKRIPHWTFAGIYSDIGSGTQAKGRRRFNAMISACRRGKIDTILTKSAHRFARNTVDALETIRMLRRWKVDIYFEIEGIHSLYESSEFLLAVVCARAQEESYSKSEDIKWGLRKAFENPESRYYQRICYGYTHILMKQKEQLAAQEQKLEELTLKIEDVETLVEEVSDIAYDKAVEVVTDTVRQETHKEDLRLVEETKDWVLSPERKAPQKEREYAAARLDGVISKIKNAMQSALTKIQKKLMQPEVKQAGKQQIQEKAKESILDFLHRAKQDSTQREEKRKKQRQRKQDMDR